MTGRQAIDTISRTPWLLAIPLSTICIIALVVTLQGDLDLEMVLHLAGATSTLGIPGLAKRIKNRRANDGEAPAEEKAP